ncbi:MAG: hypothetical protein NTZ28_02695 [Nitrospirae bacterium]|nr:hypothetical protein [Nitrospirota bacterium]
MDFTISAIALVKRLDGFVCEVSGLDCIWNVLFPDRAGKWRHLHVQQYKDSHYLTRVGDEAKSLEVVRGKRVQVAEDMGGAVRSWDGNAAEMDAKWTPILEAALRWLGVVHRDWIAANKRVRSEYPLDRRYGIVPNALVRDCLPDVYHLDKELGKAGTRKFVELVEQGFFLKREKTEVETMTAGRFFEYCRIAYIAARRKEDKVDTSLTGRELYARHADGRHEGLLDIDPDSPHEFADWIDGKHPKRTMGGHPWEIKRGGNTTHIDLAVMRPLPGVKQGFKVELRGESIGRMVETVRMFLALQAAGLPISIAHPEGVRKRLLAQDTIGIVPAYASLHRANQRAWAAEDVFDVLHYADLGRFKRRVAPFVTWEPLPIIRPRE